MKKLIPSLALVALLMTGAAAHAQTGGTTAGAPNTGAGGAAAENIALLTATGALAIGAGMYALRSRA